MQRLSLGQVASRILLVVGGLLVIGIVLRLIVAILSPVLPAWLMHDLGAGWEMLYGILSPAMGAVMAVVILGAICWVVVGKSR